MIVLYIILFIVLIIIGLLLLPIGVRVKYDDKLLLVITYGPFSIPIYPSKDSSVTSKKSKSAQIRNTAIRKKTKPKLIKPSFDFIINTIEYIIKELGRLLKCVRFKRLNATIIVSDEDAAKAATSYGRVCGLASNIYALIEHKLNKNDSDIYIDLRYNEKSTLNMDIIFNTTTIIFLYFALKIFIRILPLIDKNGKKG